MSNQIFKLLCLLGLAVVMYIPLMIIDSQLNDRKHFRDQATQSVRDSWTGEQTLLPPHVVLPYRYTRAVKVNEEIEIRSFERSRVILLDQLDVAVDLDSESRRRGIYDVPVYEANVSANGVLSQEKWQNALSAARGVEGFEGFGQAYISVGLSDARGIDGTPSLSINDANVDILPGIQRNQSGGGIHAPIDLGSEQMTLSFDINIRGLGEFRLAPMADQFTASLQSDWPHAKFSGAYLPSNFEQVDQTEAFWQVSRLNTGMSTLSDDCIASSCEEVTRHVFDYQLYNSVDVYHQTERAMKYAILFIIASFAAFYLFEIIVGLRIHPIQYSLVGLALTTFYLMLLGFTEHLSFALSYVIATLVSVGLIGVYISAIFKRQVQSLAFCVGLTTLYGMIYLILQMEDYALLAGTCLVVLILAAIMVATRQIDWYEAVSDDIKPMG